MSARDGFVAKRRERWQQLEALLRRHGRQDAEYWSDLASTYRAVCADLSRAQTLGLAEDVQGYLDELAGRAHNRLYGMRGSGRWGLVRLVFVDFPREVRASWPFFLAANVLFYGPFVLGAILAFFVDGFAASVIPESMLAQMEASYTGEEVARGAAGLDAMMAGFYVWNNVGIAFRCFATGALGGLGSVFYLVYNGVVLGTVEGYLWRVGAGWNLLTFTAGHTPWELTGVVVAGTAGLKLGWSLVVTRGRTRIGSLRAAAPSLYRLIAGTAALLLVAALIEAFWSAGPMPAPVKWAFGLFGCVVVAVWILLGGVRR